MESVSSVDRFLMQDGRACYHDSQNHNDVAIRCLSDNSRLWPCRSCSRKEFC